MHYTTRFKCIQWTYWKISLVWFADRCWFSNILLKIENDKNAGARKLKAFNFSFTSLMKEWRENTFEQFVDDAWKVGGGKHFLGWSTSSICRKNNIFHVLCGSVCVCVGVSFYHLFQRFVFFQLMLVFFGHFFYYTALQHWMCDVLWTRLYSHNAFLARCWTRVACKQEFFLSVQYLDTLLFICLLVIALFLFTLFASFFDAKEYHFTFVTFASHYYQKK